MTPYPLVKFGDVVRQVKDKVDPQTAGLEHFVGLGHIASKNLHIRRWGLVAKGTTFTNTFHRGQLLFGKRPANSGNLIIPLYVRGQAVSDTKGEYAANGL